MRSMIALVLTALVAGLMRVPTGAGGHPERTTVFPHPASQPIPKYRSRGPSNVVCKSDSKTLVRKLFKHDKRLLTARLRTLKRCRFHDIQPAIDKAKSGYRILIMPGVYKEEASR